MNEHQICDYQIFIIDHIEMRNVMYCLISSIIQYSKSSHTEINLRKLILLTL